MQGQGSSSGCAEAFRSLVEETIDSVDLIAFLSLWEDGCFRQAYLMWHKYRQNHGNPLTPDENKVDKDFYIAHVR